MNRVRTYEGIRRGARLQYKESGIGPKMKKEGGVREVEYLE